MFQPHNRNVTFVLTSRVAPARFGLPEAVPHSADGVNHLCRSILINFLTQAVHVHFDEICLGIEMAIPNVFHNFTARNQFGSVKQQELQERELFGR